MNFKHLGVMGAIAAGTILTQPGCEKSEVVCNEPAKPLTDKNNQIVCASKVIAEYKKDNCYSKDHDDPFADHIPFHQVQNVCYDTKQLANNLFCSKDPMATGEFEGVSLSNHVANLDPNQLTPPGDLLFPYYQVTYNHTTVCTAGFGIDPSNQVDLTKMAEYCPNNYNNNLNSLLLAECGTTYTRLQLEKNYDRYCNFPFLDEGEMQDLDSATDCQIQVAKELLTTHVSTAFITENGQLITNEGGGECVVRGLYPEDFKFLCVNLDDPEFINALACAPSSSIAGEAQRKIYSKLDINSNFGNEDSKYGFVVTGNMGSNIQSSNIRCVVAAKYFIVKAESSNGSPIPPDFCGFHVDYLQKSSFTQPDNSKPLPDGSGLYFDTLFNKGDIREACSKSDAKPKDIARQLIGL